MFFSSEQHMLRSGVSLIPMTLPLSPWSCSFNFQYVCRLCLKASPAAWAGVVLVELDVLVQAQYVLPVYVSADRAMSIHMENAVSFTLYHYILVVLRLWQ